ncbi:hypothetical protein AZ34_01240 [Hylemonella gracilis str. Niagara R]|uniref:Uncharacterized protein n=1 Tax=Hylemonella gracilis str. Niagara R TaxID=1458275 RepID=A0A016XCJ3_9BURK|nr:hypothetical protein [Hylemonella gracilis]EYC49829.1 hypothetical protein AZ34_01240 [Hylemonella gracilis str. Niagara R]
MTTNSFIHLDYPRSHPGADRLERTVEVAGRLVTRVRKNLSASRGLAAVLLAAMVATLLVVMDQWVDIWTDGHLLATWTLTWAIGFFTLALLAPAARSLAARTVQGLDSWSRNVARRQADERLLALARKDPRVLADIRAAMLREEIALDAGKGQINLANPASGTGFGGGQGPELGQGTKNSHAGMDINAAEFVSALAASRGLRPEVAARLSRLSRRIWNE